MYPQRWTAAEKGRAFLLVIQAKAREQRVLVTRLLLSHGICFLRKLAAMLARAVQLVRLEASKPLKGMPGLQRLQDARLLFEKLIKRAVASAILCINSNALRSAAEQLISVSVSQENSVNSESPALACKLRLLGGIFWCAVP